MHVSSTTCVNDKGCSETLGWAKCRREKAKSFEFPGGARPKSFLQLKGSGQKSLANMIVKLEMHSNQGAQRPFLNYFVLFLVAPCSLLVHCM